ncbi:MAG: hypothetical protein S0880_30310 [Actinomycetota bacterium]|nr:hypothetical protein [Actinomycetota bacterium]
MRTAAAVLEELLTRSRPVPWRVQAAAAFVLAAALLAVPAAPAAAQTAGGGDISSPTGLGTPVMYGVFDITNEGVTAEPGGRSSAAPPYYDNTRWYTVDGDGDVYFLSMRQDVIDDNWDAGNATIEIWVADGAGGYTLFYQGHNPNFGGGWLHVGPVNLAAGTTYYVAVGSIDPNDNGGIDLSLDNQFDPGEAVTVAVSSDPASPTAADTLTLTATLTGDEGGTPASGTVQFFEGGDPIAGARPSPSPAEPRRSTSPTPPKATTATPRSTAAPAASPVR